jgi:hypothetical protein
MTEIDELLERKALIDGMVMDRFVETQRWLVEAVEFLLRRAQRQERQEATYGRD